MGSLTPGSVFAGRYEVRSLIGQGGMGAVYEVVHRQTRRRVALKVLLPVLVSDSDARARFSQEASITADIESEHVVETFDAGVDRESGCPFIVMELLRGESLGERLAARQRMSANDVVEILRQVGAVLQETHARGIIHRDLKPDNVFLARRDDGSCRVKVLDFGIAKVLEQAGLSRNTVNIGTPLYMAPEQLDGSRIGPATDLFALTHIAFELLAGESYWEHEVRTAPSTMVLLRWIEGGMPELPHLRAQRLGISVGDAFDAWFLRGTARDPAHRFQNARELVLSFARAVGLPLTSLDVGRLSVTGLLPMRASDHAISLPALTTGRVATEPRAVAPLGRTGEPFATPVGRMRKASPVLVAMGVGALLAMLIGLTLLATRRATPRKSPGPEAEAADHELAASPAASAPSASATVAASATASSPPAVVAASASASTRAPVPPRTKPGSAPKPSAAVDKICREQPERCPW
jgi:eukaryotic-like serine/threonine-protein kinase